MATFIVRVELHGADEWEDYDKLHSEMENEGFSRTITGSDKVVYHLPTAEYRIASDLLTKEIQEKAKNAARRTGKPFSILTVKAARTRFFNLAKV